MSERKAFLDAIRDRPHDANLRGVFADWLDDHDEPEAATRQRNFLASYEWLKDFAYYVDADFDEMMSVAGSHCEDGEDSNDYYLFQGDKWDGVSTPKEFWEHYEVITGSKLRQGDSATIFSCSC